MNRIASLFDYRTSGQALAVTLGLALPLCGAAAFAQAVSPDALKQTDQQLEAARAEQKKSAEAEKKLRLEIEELGADRRKLSQALLDSAAKVREVEEKISATEDRLRPLENDEQSLRRSLEDRRAVIAEVLAALQRVGRRPPPAMMVSPEDALQSVRTAIMLGAVLPDMRDKVKALAANLSELVRLRTGIASEKGKLARDLAALAQDRQRTSLLIEERQKKQSEAEKALDIERQHAAVLAQQTDNLKDLIAKLEQTLDSAGRAARAAARSGDDQKIESRPDLSTLNDPGRLGPAFAFGSARGLLRLPVNGVKIRDYGASDGLGGAEKGISVATRAGAQVTSPCDAWVVYAGPFRSYGHLLILNAGGGYHVLLAGMDHISVDLGQFVLAGEPVAVMGNGSQLAAAAPIRPSQPVLYVEFRKDGSPVDSGPWWAKSESEKVRG